MNSFSDSDSSSDRGNVEYLYPYFHEDNYNDSNDSDDSDDSDYEIPNESAASDSSRAEPEPISDEDEEIFGKDNWSQDLYRNELRGIKHNDPLDERLDLGGEELNSSMLARIGHFLSRNNVCTELNLVETELTSENFQALVNGGLKDNKSIEKINLGGNVGIGKEDDMASLSVFLTNVVTGHQSEFRHLRLTQIGFSVRGCNALFSALNGLPVLRTLVLSHNDFSSVTKLGRAFESCLSTVQMPGLRSLHLNGCGLSLGGCIAVAKFLENRSNAASSSPATPTASSSPNVLEELTLSCNNIDDKCTSVLAKTLKLHPTLERLDILRNIGVSERAIDFFADALCDKSSVHTILCASNHTLKKLHMNIHSEEVESLCNINDCSECPEKAAREKLKRYYFTEDSDFGVAHFESTSIEFMPNVLHWISNNCGLSGFHHYIRHWNLPTLFSFPSAESVRLRGKINAMEKKNGLLEQEISVLNMKNKELTEEVSSLKRLLEIQKEQLKGLQHQPDVPFEHCNDSLVPSNKKRKT